MIHTPEQRRRIKDRKRQEKIRRERRALNLCTRCGEKRSRFSVNLCDKHLKENRVNRRNHYRKEKGIPLDAPIGINQGFKAQHDWTQVDWSMRDAHIARLLGCTREAVRQQRLKININSGTYDH